MQNIHSNGEKLEKKRHMSKLTRFIDTRICAKNKLEKFKKCVQKFGKTIKNLSKTLCINRELFSSENEILYQIFVK